MLKINIEEQNNNKWKLKLTFKTINMSFGEYIQQILKLKKSQKKK